MPAAYPAPFATMSALQGHEIDDEGDRDPLHRRFNLPLSELLIEDYACALYSTILLQGRLYIFPRHVCFACDLLGNVRSLVIGIRIYTCLYI